MKKILSITMGAFILMGCASSKEVAETGNTSETKEESNNGGSVVIQTNEFPPKDKGIPGTIRLSDEGCKVIIEVVGRGDTRKTLYPVNLPEEFKIDYAAILFDYNLSRAPMPEGCVADYTVTVENVRRIRK